MLSSIFNTIKYYLQQIPGQYRLPLSFIAAGLLLWVCDDVFRSDKLPSPELAGKQTANVFFTSGNDINYLLHLPQAYGKKRQQWPLILYLHGASLRGSDVNRVKRYGPPRMVEKKPEFPFILLSPQCPPEKGWHEVNGLIDLLDEIISEYAVDEGRIYLTGVSLGGSGAWHVGGEHPGKFAAIAPLCGYGNPNNASQFADLPVWVFHGKNDKIVPLANSENMYAAIKEEGGPIKFTKLPNAGHGIVEEVYGDNALYDWFLKQER